MICPACLGTGAERTKDKLWFDWSKPCPKCRGTGHYYPKDKPYDWQTWPVEDKE